MGYSNLPKKLKAFIPDQELTYHSLKRGGGKYKNKSCRCASGHIHDSIFEAGYCDDLKTLKNAGEILHFEIQKKVELYVKSVKICTHYVDFYVVGADGSAQFHETKGVATDVWKLKRKLTEVLFPDIPYKVIREKNTFRKR